MKIDKKFTAVMQKSTRKGGWTYVIWPESSEFFGTKGVVKVTGTIDGHMFQSTFMAMGNGTQMLPIKSETRKLLDKEAGKSVEVHLLERRSE